MSSPRPAPPIAYFTDVEGQWRKLDELVADNPLVTLDAHGRIVVAPQAVLVFGGDAIDRGAEARRIVAALLEAKKRQPDQVVLLAGNRDLNKMRLRRELGGFPPLRAPDEVKRAARPDLLRWIFCNAMNAPKAFELRREELGASVSDDDVVDSFLSDVAPDGPIGEYLAHCQLAYRAGETLFVHGAVTDESLGVVPGREARLEGVDAWIDALNAWCSGQVAAYRDDALDPSGEPRWRPIIAYQAPIPGTRLNQASVVYGRYTDEDGNPSLPSRATIERLLRDGVARVVAGHTPTGDCPAVLRDGGFELVMADNSYSRLEAGTRVRVDGARLSIEGRVELDDGTRERVAFDLDLARDPAPIGLRDRDSMHLVKGRLSGGGFLTFKGLPHYKYEQKRATEDELRARPLAPPR